MDELTGEYIKKYRLLRGWTQEQLALKTGQSVKTINNHEGKGVIPKSKQDLYKRVLRVMEYSDLNNESHLNSNVEVSESSKHSSSESMESRIAEAVLAKILPHFKNLEGLVSANALNVDRILDGLKDKIEKK